MVQIGNKNRKYFEATNNKYLKQQNMCGVVLFIFSQGGIARPNLRSSSTKKERGENTKQHSRHWKTVKKCKPYDKDNKQGDLYTYRN